MMGLEPIGNHLLVDPAVPDMLDRLDILDIPGRWELTDVFSPGKSHIPEESLRLAL